MAHGVRPWLTLVLALLAALARGTSEHQAREHARRKVEREENLRLADDFRQADTNGDEFLARDVAGRGCTLGIGAADGLHAEPGFSRTL